MYTNNNNNSHNYQGEWEELFENIAASIEELEEMIANAKLLSEKNLLNKNQNLKQSMDEIRYYYNNCFVVL